ncbi:MAG: ferredoxin [Deltaproteobacteria bacterium]|nr:MAG: ferredoxin [Deltaproteobacteria bacterium]
MAKIRFKPPVPDEPELEVDVDPDTTLLEAAEEVGAKVGSSCGGQCACSTCHVYVLAGEDALSDMEDNEDDRLDMAFDVRPESRLGCQARVVRDDAEIVVQISEESLKAWYDEHPSARKASG